ncbi:NERD domain-containing protein [Bacillus sp. V3]|uniref:nuclease-related domain-containing protein n=1 Tax=[Bacillus] enclensis TaxID=1402860 RepID=UPI0018D33F3B|nr:nuclease-related domain-containing protein [[Bacillus] enclensis]MBH9968778.1 NERD domain-containing protein [[Bacillus] enclensis]QTC40955.1 NERD domain-containing protein [Bacillus sp. V3]QWC23059.1 NERD domain-containing protein [Bacillus haikouensis]
MAVKEREFPIRILQNRALIKRLRKNHEVIPRVESDLKKISAGYKGERTVDYQLGFLEDKKYSIFHNIRIKVGTQYFQIDTLLMTTCYMVIIEVKNLAGIVRIDPQIRQCTRILGETQEGFVDPVSQVEKLTLLFKKWLSKHGFNVSDIEILVVISNPQTTIDFTVRPEIHSPYTKIIHSQNILHFITTLNKKYKHEIISAKDLNKIKKLILKHHSVLTSNVLDIYGIVEDEIITGVQCESCNAAPLPKVGTYWTCFNCSYRSKNAHIQAIDDYFLLMSNHLTNSTLRNFLHIPSRHAATYMLKSLNLKTSGIGKGKRYFQ